MQHISTYKPDEPTYRDGTSETQRRTHIDRLAADAATAVLICPDCQGMAVSCRTCDGFGLVCPTCRGSRFVKLARANEGPGYHRHPLQSCHVCCDSDGKQQPRLVADAIKAVLRKQQVTA